MQQMNRGALEVLDEDDKKIEELEVIL